MTLATPPVDQRHGLTADEYAAAVEALGRVPNEVELGMFGAMWSEHCAYKHSRPLLGRLPKDGARVLVGPGENAGALDIGDGLAVVFKIESHNHPSAVEPYQGAATGVGGIIHNRWAIGCQITGGIWIVNRRAARAAGSCRWRSSAGQGGRPPAAAPDAG